MTTQELIVKQRGSLLIYADRHGVSKACKNFGVSRTTFYKIKKQFLATGSLVPKIRRRPKMPNEAALSKKKLLLSLVKEHPTWGPARYAYAFKEKGIAIAQSCLWYHLKRFGLHRRYERLLYLEQLKKRNQPVTERTLQEIKRHCEKIKEGLWPGHIVALDTFYVGNLKGIGRIYQISGIDLCSRYGWANLYTAKDQSATIHFVEESLIPKLFNNGVEIESILTDNGSEFIGSKFQQMLADYDIGHHRIPKGKPIFNGYCERFQRTLHEEFYQRVFRMRFFKNLDELTQALNEYLVYYNFQRAHFGVVKTGAIPIDVLKSKRSFLQQRFKELLA
jgi:transposase InsO family protein